MKLEFTGGKNGVLDEDSFVYITKGEVLKAYNDDSMRALNELNGIIEMFTSPACFNDELTPVALKKICEEHLVKTTYKGLTLSYKQDCEGRPILQLALCKK